MKNILSFSLLTSLLFGCSTLPSYHEMICKRLIEKEILLQSNYKVNISGSILNSIADVFEDSNESKVDAHSADVELNNTKNELRSIQSVIYQKKSRAKSQRRASNV